MRVRYLLIGATAVIAAGAVVTGLRLADTLGQMSDIGSGVSVAAVRDTGNLASASNAEATPSTASSQANFVVMQESPLPEIPTRYGDDTEEMLLFDEDEFLLEYFGDSVSLNDIGQLRESDPEFERMIRELANEFGEIPESN